jgi:tetratricopeptide (TPR) repeat protein/predicted Ser/Thr protein kinase
MTLERKRRVFAIVRAAVDVPAAERGDLVARECGGDTTLASEVADLLANLDTDLLDRPASEVAARLVDATLDEVVPASGFVGGWRVVRVLGAGGMGTVYLVEREGDGYVQQAALKLIKRGMDSAEVLARFRRERHILARLTHPNIARMLDGGIAEDGRPYLVMEYVDGEPLVEWARRTGADVDACVGVVLQLCDAVAHAHRQLIVHRDIKPGNVLVDATGMPKLLDFGIAKVLADSADDARTATGHGFLSPAYAAPEQRSAGGVSTSSDIYQLGLLLFEMLTGSRYTPAAGGTTAAIGLLEQARARAREHGPPAIPARALRGDGGIIVLRTLDAEPERRYATVEALADDLRRWRSGEPILARPDSAMYRLNRYVARHRVAASFAVVAVVALLGGTVLAVWQAERAAREARLARAAQAFLTSVFDASAPDVAAGARVTARELLDRGVERVDSDLAAQPRLRSEMLATLGTLYRQLGQFQQARDLLARALEVMETTDGGVDAEVHQRAVIESAVVARELAQLDDAQRGLDAALRSDLPTALRARALAERAQVAEERSEFAAALDDARAAASLDRGRGIEGRADVSRDRLIEALVLTRMGRFDEAEVAFADAIDIATAALGAGNTQVAQIHNDLAVMQISRSRPLDGEREARTALELRRQRLSADHPAIAESLQVLGGALRQQGRLDEAELALEEGLAIQRKALGDRNGDVSNSLNSLGIIAAMRGRIGLAERYLSEALSIQREVGQGDTSASATIAANLGGMLMRLGRYDEAEDMLGAALAYHRATLGDRHPAIVNDENTLAQLALRRGDLVRAQAHARRATEMVDVVFAPGRESASIHLVFASTLLRARILDEALLEVRKADAMLVSVAPTAPRNLQALAIEADILIALGRLDEAAPLVAQVMSGRQGSDASARIGAHALRARLATAQGRPGDARRDRAAARVLLAQVVDVDPELAADIDRD